MKLIRKDFTQPTSFYYEGTQSINSEASRDP